MKNPFNWFMRIIGLFTALIFLAASTNTYGKIDIKQSDHPPTVGESYVLLYHLDIQMLNAELLPVYDFPKLEHRQVNPVEYESRLGNYRYLDGSHWALLENSRRC